MKKDGNGADSGAGDLPISDQLREHLREIGRKGGRVSSPEKRAAAAANAKLGNASRWGRKPRHAH